MNIRSLFLAATITCYALFTSAQTTIIDSFIVDDVYRSFRIYIPATFTEPERPLVLNFHNKNGNAETQQNNSGFMPIADTAGFYLVMPQATEVFGTPFWNVGYNSPVDDVKFISALIDTLANNYQIDVSKVYATGMSNGGFMVHLLGIELSDKIAAIASVAGTILPDKYAEAVPGNTIPAMQIHGTADPTVPYDGSPLGISVDTLIKFWVLNNGCDDIPVETAVPDINTGDNCTADHFVWSGGFNGANVELFRINGGEHTWPGTSLNPGICNQDFLASAEIWRFFSQYILNPPTAVNELPASQVSLLNVFPNPVQDWLYINSAIEGFCIISDITGKLLISTTAKAIDVSWLPAGIYFVQNKCSSEAGVARFIKQ